MSDIKHIKVKAGTHARFKQIAKDDGRKFDKLLNIMMDKFLKGKRR